MPDYTLSLFRAHGGGYKRLEERMRIVEPRLELGVKLAAEHKRVIAQLGDLDEPAIGRLAANDQPGVLKDITIVVVQFPAMAVPLADVCGPVRVSGPRSVLQVTRIGTQAHRASERIDFPL